MNRTPAVFGITGFKRSGKNTVGKILAEILPGETVEYSFAEPLKRYAYDLNPLVSWDEQVQEVYLQQVVDDLGWEKAKDDYPEVRRTLQRLGTEVFRKHVSEDYWPNLANKFIEDSLADDKNVVITDVRFQNEADIIHSWVGHVLRVDRKEVEPDPTQPLHASEAGIPAITVDAVIDNNGSKDYLKSSVVHELVRLIHLHG